MHGAKARRLRRSGEFDLRHLCNALLISDSKMTDVYEGSLIRMFRRLEELLMQMTAAAKVMGSEELEQKFEAALGLIKRGMFLQFYPFVSFWLMFLTRYCRRAIIVSLSMIWAGPV